MRLVIVTMHVNISSICRESKIDKFIKVGEQVDKFEQDVMQFVEQQQLIERGDRLVIACSGGVDSMALLSFCIALQQVELVVAHVDHMLRGQDSYEDYLFVEQFCQQHNVKFVGARIDIPTLHAERGGNLQALCRTERYRFLQQIVREENATKLLTAHHADDQLESMLMAFVKSSTASSLQGIQMRRKFEDIEIIRPFLMVTKDEIRGYLQQKNISFREDASNAKDSYLRNRIRHHVVPLLQEENVQVSKHAVHFAQQLSEDEQYLQQQAQHVYSTIVQKVNDYTYQFEIDAFVRVPVALQRRLVLILLNYIYSEANTFQSYTLNKAILSLIQSREGSAEIHLPNHIVARRQYGLFTVGPREQTNSQATRELTLNEWHEYNGIRLYIGEARNVSTLTTGQTVYYFNKASVTWPLRIRTRQNGDKMRCLGMTHSKKLSRIFIDDKIPLHARESWPILADNNDEILTLLGIRVSTIFSKHKRANDDYIFITERL